ncbi:MAG: type I methionyl aminopeptidase [Acidobacteria bacterium]|nr:type I methionyl aminopeptidase [Acidobacteriota bacterium]
MSITSDEELQGMARAGRVVARALAAMRDAVVPGATPADVEAVGAEILRQEGAQAAPVVIYGAPCAAFVSVNDAVVHGLPTRTPLRAGDLVKIDVTPLVDGYVADGAITVAVEPSTSRGRRLARAAERALAAALAIVRPGLPVHALGAAIDGHVRREGFSVVRDLTGHGVGRSIHEPPEVPNFDPGGRSPLLTEGLVLAVEPLVAEHSGRIRTLKDRWTIATRDGGWTAHWEHTIVVMKDGALVLTAPGH